MLATSRRQGHRRGHILVGALCPRPDKTGIDKYWAVYAQPGTD